ncbi:MAG: tetratricopeptide repeat protein [Anaerolineales bacterium]
MNMVKCSSCGANVSCHDQVCSHCGTANPDYRALDNEVNTLLEKGRNAFKNEQHAAAIESYYQAIALNPDVFDAYFYLAASLTALGRRKEAIQAMQKAQAIRPGNTAIYVNLGLLCKQEGQKAEARKYLEKALKMIDSDSAMQNRDQLRQHIKKELGDLKRWGLF